MVNQMPNSINLTERNWKIVEDYCNGVSTRNIEKTYNIDIRYPAKLLQILGMSPRPQGFANYQIAHKWVINARKEYALVRKKWLDDLSPHGETGDTR